MRLAQAPDKYDRQNEQDLRRELEREDARNFKTDRDTELQGRIIAVSPNGTRYAMSVSNAGATVWTAI